MKLYLLLLIAFFPTILFSQNKTINLNSNWKFRQENSSEWHTAKVPGNVHSDLYFNKLIPDPFFEDNENKLAWVDTLNWEYKSRFIIDKDILNKKNIDIVFDGLDTYTEIYINGKLLLKTDNMFRQWISGIKPFIHYGNNDLLIKFKSAKKTVDSIATSVLPLKRPDNSRVYARKAQYQFGWDWGPTFISAGIYKKIWIDAYDNFSTVAINQDVKDSLNVKRKKEINLIQEPDSIGVSFKFEKNGKPIYMKGANWIPADIFINKADRNKYLNLLTMAKKANMNMLRVWGGGIYESDDFYDLCDSLGIYIWQDFMFACAMYPADGNFVVNVKEEIKQQILRLRHHPCIVLWCGNNEIDEAINNWGWQSQYNLSDLEFAMLRQEYNSIFKDSISKWVYEFDSTRPYISTSPKYGWGHKESFTEGDSHYWGLWWGLQDWEVFKEKTGRFVSEYGMQSMPNFETIKAYTKENNLYLYSGAIKSHQKANEGFNKLNYYLTRYFIDSTSLTKMNLEDYTYITQCLQAYILENSIAVHRSQYPKNMGTLLWQLNDCWPVTSWSIIDYYGKPKASWYAVKRAYENKADNTMEFIPKNLALKKPEFKLKVEKNTLSITSTEDAYFISLSDDLKENVFSDNYFNLKKNETKIIALNNFKNGKDIKTKSLYDIISKY